MVTSIARFSALFFVLFISVAAGQTGAISGVVRDSHSGETLIGANISVVEAARGGSSDVDGKFHVRGIAPGTYTVRVTYIGYTAKSVSGVTVRPDQATKLDVSLDAATVQSKEVVITAERQTNTEASILAQRRRASTIGDGFSAEQVKLTPDATTGDALRRVTGISLVDSKFIFVRGVTDRYNSAMLNGVSVTSTDTDTDRKSFSFDMVPSNLVENTMVTKTSTPDLPADFTGGLVQINTLDFPDTPTIKLSLSSSYNALSNLKTVNRAQGGGSDWIGLDDGTRRYPAGEYNSHTLGKVLPNNWAQQSRRAPLNMAMNLSAGDRMILNDDADQLGYIAAFSYRNGVSRSTLQYAYTRLGSPIYSGGGPKDVASVLWGGLLNLSYKVGGNHKFSFKNNFNQSADDKASAYRIVDENENDRTVHVTEWDQRSMFVSQLTGTHHFAELLSGLDVTWRGSYTSSLSKRPDRKTYIYSKNVRAPESEFFLERGDRSWANLDEYSRGASLDAQFPVLAAKVKLGGLFEKKERYFDIQFYLAELERGSSAWNLLSLPITSVFDPENFGSGKLVLSRLSDKRDTYTGASTLLASYAMLDLPLSGFLSFAGLQPFLSDIRFTGGARLENSEQLVNTVSPFSTDELYVAKVKNIDVLPSANLTFVVNPVVNIRLAASQSVNRPEFRELSSFYFYDYSVYEGTFGNPLLQRAYSHNYDARLEYFPGAGEVLAVSYFHKNISNAIEQRILPSSNPERTWFNSPHGVNRGWEVEMRTTLAFLGSYGANVSITGNYTRIASDIEYTQGYKIDKGGGVYLDEYRTETREMQGQSPYMLNLSLLFREPVFGTSINILYNEFGKRLDAVGDERGLDVYEEARGAVDLSITQNILPRLDLKFTAREILVTNPGRLEGSASDGRHERRFVTREGNEYKRILTDPTYALQFSYTF
ncbi:MAG: carboxypeptidase-like regulatory domain-containing protein [Ignavibacteria bacterium]|nr:carboxypeptidase-like regulatory domain-containing protein [Ignavibacteria bacterium]